MRLPHTYAEALELVLERRGRGHCARALYAAGQFDGGYVADGWLRSLDPVVRRYRQLVRQDEAAA